MSRGSKRWREGAGVWCGHNRFHNYIVTSYIGYAWVSNSLPSSPLSYVAALYIQLLINGHTSSSAPTTVRTGRYPTTSHKLLLRLAISHTPKTSSPSTVGFQGIQVWLWLRGLQPIRGVGTDGTDSNDSPFEVGQHHSTCFSPHFRGGGSSGTDRVADIRVLLLVYHLTLHWVGQSEFWKLFLATKNSKQIHITEQPVLFSRKHNRR